MRGIMPSSRIAVNEIMRPFWHRVKKSYRARNLLLKLGWCRGRHLCAANRGHALAGQQFGMTLNKHRSEFTIHTGQATV